MKQSTGRKAVVAMVQTTEEQRLGSAIPAPLQARVGKYQVLPGKIRLDTIWPIAIRPGAICLCLLVSACSDNSPSAPEQTTQTSNLSTPQVQPSAEPVLTLDPSPVVTQSGSESSTQEAPDSTVTHNDHTGAISAVLYTDSELDIWPPQPQNITEITALDVATDNASELLAKTVRSIKSQGSFDGLLGTRHEVLARHELRDKSGKLTSIEVEIFDYDANQVLTVELAADRSTVVNHTLKAAHLYQPPESQDEVRRAIELAAIALDQQGFTNPFNLKGTGLLAYPTAAQSAASGFHFFNDRKIYVTFGDGKGVLPEYRALVNLSTGIVESSGAIQ